MGSRGSGVICGDTERDFESRRCGCGDLCGDVERDFDRVGNGDMWIVVVKNVRGVIILLLVGDIGRSSLIGLEMYHVGYRFGRSCRFVVLLLFRWVQHWSHASFTAVTIVATSLHESASKALKNKIHNFYGIAIYIHFCAEQTPKHHAMQPVSMYPFHLPLHANISSPTSPLTPLNMPL
jgi:hypothetical protein